MDVHEQADWLIADPGVGWLERIQKQVPYENELECNHERCDVAGYPWKSNDEIPIQ